MEGLKTVQNAFDYLEKQRDALPLFPETPGDAWYSLNDALDILCDAEQELNAVIED